MELSMSDLRELIGGNSSNKNSFLEIGKNLFIRTVTMIYTGKLESENSESLLLSSVAWIPDTGRYADSLVSCDFSEVEPYPEGKKVIIFKSGILDVVEIKSLPRIQK